MDRRQFLQSGIAAAAAAAQAGAQTAGTSKVTSSLMLWTVKGSFETKLETAAASGVQSVELVDEHVRWNKEEIERTKKLVRSMRLSMDTIIATPSWKSRPVSMVKPEERDNFLADVRQAIEFAKRLEIPQIILMSGDNVPGKDFESQYVSLVEGCKRAGDLADKANLTLIVEPLNNKVDHKGFFLSNCVDGIRLIKDVDNPHVKLLFDIYHEQVQLGNVIRTMKQAAPYVAVFHIADNPGRNDPGTGEMNYSNIYKAIKDMGFGGYVTMEYIPVGEAVPSLTKAVKAMREVLA